MQAWDDVRGGSLRWGDVVNAMREEIQYIINRGIWEIRTIEECWRKMGKAPIGVGWVDTNKGSDEESDVRSRLVARNFRDEKDKEREDLFAGTPPLEAERMQFSRAVTRTVEGKVRKMMFIDAKKANLNPRCDEDVYIELPAEAGVEGGMCGMLVYWLYGCKKAAQAWDEFYATKLEEVGFARGKGSGVVFYHERRDVSYACHGDDFTFAREEKELWWIAAMMEGWFQIKVRAVMGPEDADDKEVVILGRLVRWQDKGVEFEADPRHRKVLMEYFGFGEDSRGAATNGDKERKEEGGDEVELDRK